jgi:tRNA-splicing ligase RtcB
MSEERAGPIVRRWVAGKIPAAAGVLIERLTRAADVVRIAIMPDVHAATDVCVGCVVATRRLIYPAAVGGDIGCGIAAMAFDAEADDLLGDEPRPAKLLDALKETVPSNKHRQPRELPTELREKPFAEPRLEAVRRDAAVQFGTLGRGNHFLEFQRDEEGRLWLMVHSGSRAVGPAVRDWYVARASRPGARLLALDAESEVGHGYLADAEWARAYAAANRRAMAEAVAALIGRLFGVSSLPGTWIECDHNHVRREEHFGEALWVHRKGAAGAAEGQPGLIPGSMGSRSFHVEGRGEPESLCSSSHGAGRVMSREEARRRVMPRELKRQMEGVHFDEARAERLRDEAPAAYKDIGQVMRAQRDLVRVVRVLRPMLSYKGV